MIPFLDEISEEAKAIGAVNTIKIKEGKLKGTYIRVGSSNRQADETIIHELERQKRNISYDSELIYDKIFDDVIKEKKFSATTEIENAVQNSNLILLSKILKNRINITRQFALDHSVNIILKGASSIICQPNGMTTINPTGNPGMATAGTGDILTGIIASLIMFAPVLMSDSDYEKRTFDEHIKFSGSLGNFFMPTFFHTSQTQTNHLGIMMIFHLLILMETVTKMLFCFIYIRLMMTQIITVILQCIFSIR